MGHSDRDPDGGLPPSEVRSGLQRLPSPARFLEEIFLHASVGLQIYDRSGHSVLVNPMHTRLFGAVPPPEYNIFEDTVLVERGVTGLVRRAFDGESIAIPPIWYDARDLRNIKVEGPGRRVAVAAELVPLRAGTEQEGMGEVTHVLCVFQDVTELHSAREEAEAARVAAEAAAARSAFLADAGRLLGSSLDYEDTLARVAHLATPTLADFCLIDLVGDDGQLRRVAAWHADPQGQPVLDELRQRFPPTLDSPQPATRAVVSGRPQLLPEVDDAVVAAHATGPDHAAVMLRLGVQSLLAVPLTIGGRTMGAITLGYVGTRRYTAPDVSLAEALANQAAVAIDNARLYRQAEIARAEAEGANRTKDEFLAMLGHELRNPLAPMVTALELTRRREGASPELQVIERQVQHLRRLIDDLLDVSRITRGKLELHPQVFELCEAVAEGLELARPLLEERQHILKVECPEQGLPVHADRERLAQIVCNLLSNAARYTPAAGHIALGAEREDGTIVLRVRDDGIGIEPELRQRIFEPFSQGKQTLDRSGGGLGLGLAIVKSLAETHGGSVSAHSDGPGHGSEFEVRLPAAQDVATPPAAAAAPAQAGEEEHAAAGARILVVDDNQDAADLLAEMLQLYGYEASTAYHPTRALELALEMLPDVAFIDIGLPEIDGHELARRLRSQATLANMRMVALTGYGRESDRELAKRSGFDAHLTKPADVEDVLKVLADLLRTAESH
jgi:signal transduction histidine kinase/ActR/RegA family two-component response regulator